MLRKVRLLFILLCSQLLRATATACLLHPNDTADDEQDRPGDVHEPPREDAHRAEQEVHARKDREYREHLVVWTVARLAVRHALAFTFHFFHYVKRF